ncbi:Cell division protein FtsZ 1 [uncultured archaeon]|nr:Cell division protein FtsZ 1 [uncultured archaeon]
MFDSLVKEALETKIDSGQGIDSDSLKIVVVGAGGGGGNTVNRLSRMGIGGAQLLAFNTDLKDLQKLNNNISKVLIGGKITRGLGAGGFPDIGAKAAEASSHEIEEALKDTNLCFLCAGMGGGTGTGSAPIIADIAKAQGAIVVGMVTYPFKLERSRQERAQEGIRKLKKVSDSVIIIDNNKLMEYVPNLPVDKAFMVADEVVARAVRAITETIKEPSLINLDFADIKAVLEGGKVSVISVGEANGPDRVALSVKNTRSHPLLDVDMTGAKGAIIHISGGPDMTIGEANEVGKLLTEGFDEHGSVMWGARIREELEGKLEVISIVSGVKPRNIMSQKGPVEFDDEPAPYISRDDGVGLRFV